LAYAFDLKIKAAAPQTQMLASYVSLKIRAAALQTQITVSDVSLTGSWTQNVSQTDELSEAGAIGLQQDIFDNHHNSR